MKDVKKMIESAVTERDAREMLRLWQALGKITIEEMKKGYKLIDKEFKN